MLFGSGARFKAGNGDKSASLKWVAILVGNEVARTSEKKLAEVWTHPAWSDALVSLPQ